MFKVETDTAHRLVRLTFTKHVSVTQARHCCTEMAAVLATLPPGFRLLTDLSGLDEMEYACATEIRGIMDQCRAKGISEVVRVIPDPKKDIGFKVLSFFHYGHAVPVLTCATLAEAQAKLAV